MKSDRLSGQTNDAFHQHDMGASVTNSDDVTALGFMKCVGQPVNEVDPGLSISWQHAHALDPNGQQNEIEDDQASRYQYNNPRNGSPWVLANYNHLHPGRAPCRFFVGSNGHAQMFKVSEFCRFRVIKTSLEQFLCAPFVHE
jgi:hypothetical protein